ncbi:MAG: hypothetical protein RIS87_499 [Pseudomonadota bacterium]
MVDMNPAENNQSLAFYDNAPFFDRALKHAVQNRLIDQAKIDEMINDAATGTIQIAEYFGATAHLRENLQQASVWMASLVSLHLENESNGDLQLAAQMIKEKSFRTLSRGGSQMLKALYALPEDDHFGALRFDTESDFLKRCLSSHMTLAKYRQSMVMHSQFKLELGLANYLLKKMATTSRAFNDLHAPAKHVLRSAVLFMAYGAKKIAASKLSAGKLSTGKAGFPDENALFEIFTAMRKEWSFLGDVSCSEKFLEEIPEDYLPLALQTLASIQQEDIPKIVSPAVPLATIFADLKVRQYFFLFDPMNDVSQFDKKLAEEWFVLTNGTEDDALLLSLFISASAGLKLKTSLTVAEVKKAVLNIRENGLFEKEVIKLIKKAPHDEQEQLQSLWTEFIEDASLYLLDESDENLSEAVAYLKDHCNIIVPAKK